MIRFALTVAVSALGGAALAAPLPPPISPASDGKLQCYAPDTARKTCQALAGYVAKAGGVIDNPSTVLVSASPAIAMAATSPVTVKDGKVCGFVRPEDVSAASFTVDGKLADASQAAMLKAQLTKGMQSVFGHEVCTAYVADGGMLAAKVTIDGQPQAGNSQQVIWVSPAEGYKVAP